eukprot:g48335.t1
MQVGDYCDQSVGMVERIVEETKDGHITRGEREGIKMDSNKKIGLVGACRMQMVREPVPQSAFGLPVLEETTLGTRDTIDQGKVAGVVEELVGSVELTKESWNELNMWKVDSGGEGNIFLVMGSDYGDGEDQDGEGGIRNGPGELDSKVEGVGEVDKLLELLVGAQNSTDVVINMEEKE